MNYALTLSKLENRLQLIKLQAVRRHAPIDVLEGCIFPDGDSGYSDRKALRLEESVCWGSPRHSFQLHGSFRIGPRQEHTCALQLMLGHSPSLELLSFLYGPEAVIYIDGKEYAGLDPNHSEIFLDEEYADGKRHELYLQGWTGIKDEQYTVGCLAAVYIHTKTRDLADLAEICLDTIRQNPEDAASIILLDALNMSLNNLDLYEPFEERFYVSVAITLDILHAKLDGMDSAPVKKVIACGHGHLDLAWLWRTGQSVQKGARTFLNVLRLMARDSGFYYSQTQAQLYQWIEHEYPAIFQQIRKRVQTGQWEILGGMWVEADCNITGAESLVRQFLLFDIYMREKFGTNGSPVVWLPDTFGFCGQLPQLMCSAGMHYFATAKLTWNQVDKMPSEYFWWQGIDGHKVLSYIVSTSRPKWWGATYSADLSPEELLSTQAGQKAPYLHNEILIAYGNGDGGGGPTEQMLRWADMMERYPVPALPLVRKGRFKEFFERLETDSANKLPIWVGELYFELHRGTYTSQANIKKRNKECEVALHFAEFVCAWAAEATGFYYPSARFRDLWEIMCLNQFHDILPGSSIHDVYVDTQRMYGKVLDACDAIIAEAMDHIKTLVAEDAEFIVVNSTSFSQTADVCIPYRLHEGECVCDAEGELTVTPLTDETLVRVPDIPRYGFKVLKVMKSLDINDDRNAHALFSGTADRLNGGFGGKDAAYILSNDKILVAFDQDAQIVRWFDREKKRDILPKGGLGAQWRLYEDRPADWDAWDIDEYYLEKGYRTAKAVSVTPFILGTQIAGLDVEAQIGKSVITVRIWINDTEKDLRFDIKIDFNERHELLRIVFPVEIHCDHAAFGTQFGSVTRPTHFNTSWDRAKFETCMHQWADYAEGDYGVSLLSDCKYGVSIHGNEISLTVLKSATFPDPQADVGKHAFSISLVPHSGVGKEETIKKAYLLAQKPRVFPIRNAAGRLWKDSFVQSLNSRFVIETVKRAEDDSGTIIRGYESCNTRGSTRISFGRKIGRASRCTILEKDETQLTFDDKGVEIEYLPYEIITLKITR